MDTYSYFSGIELNSTSKQNSDNILYLLFNWFDKQLKSTVLECINTFWENKFDVKVQSITTNSSVKDDFTSKGEIYFTAELSLCPPQKAYVRISSDFVRVLFHEYFGSNMPIFKLQDLSELEIKILNSFCEFLNNDIKTFIIPHQEIPKENLRNKGVFNIAILIGRDGEKIGKIVLTLPQNCLKTEKLILNKNFSIDDFLNTTAYVNILVGTSKLALNDLKTLCEGDIILLENSNVNSMEIKTTNIKKGFKVNPEPSLLFDLDEDEEDLGADMTDEQNIWDGIQIEVGAEFDKVKMTLGELKQISQGLVIELGPVFNNKVSLLVEDKVVAKGELIIINDKYGVKIDEIVSSNSKEQDEAIENVPAPEKLAAAQTKPNEPVQNSLPQPKPVQNPAPNTANKTATSQQEEEDEEDEDDEEFDYSDFEEEDN